MILIYFGLNTFVCECVQVPLLREFFSNLQIAFLGWEIGIGVVGAGDGRFMRERDFKNML